MLEALGARASLAVLTNKPRAATVRILNGLKLGQFFADDAIIGGDGPLPRKPDPAGLANLCARAGVSAAETVMVGDSRCGLANRSRIGTRICLARYGFGFREFPRAEAARRRDPPRPPVRFTCVESGVVRTFRSACYPQGPEGLHYFR